MLQFKVRHRYQIFARHNRHKVFNVRARKLSSLQGEKISEFFLISWYIPSCSRWFIELQHARNCRQSRCVSSLNAQRSVNLRKMMKVGFKHFNLKFFDREFFLLFQTLKQLHQATRTIPSMEKPKPLNLWCVATKSFWLKIRKNNLILTLSF